MSVWATVDNNRANREIKRHRNKMRNPKSIAFVIPRSSYIATKIGFCSFTREQKTKKKFLFSIKKDKCFWINANNVAQHIVSMNVWMWTVKWDISIFFLLFFPDTIDLFTWIHFVHLHIHTLRASSSIKCIYFRFIVHFFVVAESCFRYKRI